jgi:RNA recognition motif-containing protein
MKEIYVGNLPYGVSEDDLRSHFGSFGDIISLKLISDKFTGQSKGFGFIEFSSKDEAEAAVKATNGQDFQGRSIRVNISRPKESGDRGGDRGDRGGRGGNAGGGNRW